MPKRRRKKTVRIIYQSSGPLPARIAEQYAGQPLVFSDASAKRNGGLAAVLFSAADAEVIIATQSVPLDGSNALEFQAVLLALSQAWLHFPGQTFSLFTDNRDAADRFQRAGLQQGLEQDAELMDCLSRLGIGDAFAHASIRWIKGHASCRGNTLADLYAAEAAS